MSTAPARRPWPVFFALAAVAIALVAVTNAVGWYGHACAELLVDQDAVVSGIGSPSWESVRLGLRFPDRVIAVDGAPITTTWTSYAGDAYDEAIARAFAAGHTRVDVRVQTSAGVREVTLPVHPFGAAEWWLDGGVLFLAAALYVLAAMTALAASPDGKLSRTFAFTAFVAAAFLLTLFDAQTTRQLVPLWHVAFALAPGAFVTLALRLPDDAPVLARAPWIPSVLLIVGLALAGTTIVGHQAGVPATALQQVCSVFLGASQLFFVVTFLVRFARARGERRTAMRALLGAIAPPHALLGLGILLANLSSRGSTASFFLSLPVLSLMPLSAVTAFIRHDLWGSRALVSRVATLTVTASIACAVAVAIGAAFGSFLGIPFSRAFVAAAAAAIASAALVSLAVRIADRGFFPSRAEYKPTVEQLSEHLASINDPDDVARAVERTVKRWLACESVTFVPRDPDDTPLPPVAMGDPREGELLALPVTFRQETLGLLRVGKKRGGALLTSEDMDLLRTIANQAALALAHARSYRELEERRRQQAEAWRGERLALIETLAAEIAHEIRYPINYFRSVFQRGTTTGELDAEDIEIGCEEVDRLERLVSGLRRIAHHRIERRVVSVAALAARAEVLLRDALGARTIELAVHESAHVRADFDQATQLVVNLLSNALDAAGPTGRVGLVWREPDGEGATLVVWDTGPGFEGEAAQLFAPWFTTKPRGTGLGLAISQRIVRTHGWTIDARRVEGRTHFLVQIPASDLVGEGATEVVPSEPDPMSPSLRM